jgi:hypothetical protein
VIDPSFPPIRPTIKIEKKKQVPALNALAVWLAHDQQQQQQQQQQRPTAPTKNNEAKNRTAATTSNGPAEATTATGRVEARLLQPQGQAALVAMLESTTTATTATTAAGGGGQGGGGRGLNEQLLAPLLDILGRAPALRSVGAWWGVV